LNEIKVGDRYKFRGSTGIIRYIDGQKSDAPVLFETDHYGIVYLFNKKGQWATNHTCMLEKICLYEDIPIDAPVRVAVSKDSRWYPAHFAGMLDGWPSVWAEGRTSHTANGMRTRWPEFSVTNLEEVL